MITLLLTVFLVVLISAICSADQKRPSIPSLDL